MDFTDIPSLIVLGLDALVGLGLLFAILGGLIRGFQKQMHRLIVLSIAVLLFFILLKPITNLVVNTKIDLPGFAENILPEEITTYFEDGPASIGDVITKVVAENVYPDDPTLQANSKVATLAVSLSKTVVMAIVYVIGLFGILIIRIILNIICLILRKILHIKLKRKSRLLGMALGVALFAVNFIVLFLPFFGMISLSTTIINDVNTYQEQLDVDTDLGEIGEFVEAYENSIVKKGILNPITTIFCKDKSATFDAQYVANSIWIETDAGRVKLYKEYSNIKDVIPTILKVVELADEENEVIDLSVLTKTDIENIAKLIKDSNLLRVAIPVAIEYVAYTNKTEENSEIFELIVNIDWNKEIDGLANLIDSLKNHLNIKIDLENPESLLSNQEVINLVKDLVDKIFNLSLVTDIALPLVIDTLYEENLKELEIEYELDFSSIKDINWKSEGKSLILTLVNVGEILINANINLEDFKSNLNDETLANTVDSLFNELASSSFITDEVIPLLVKYALSQAKESSDIEINFEDLENVDWSDNLPSIATMLKDIIVAYQKLNIDFDNFKEVFKNPFLQDELNTVVNAVLNVEVVSEYLLPLIMNELCETLIEEELKDFDLNLENIKKTNWKEEINAIKNVMIEVLNAYQDLEFNKDEWTDILEREELDIYLNNIVEEALKSKLLKEEFIPSLADKLIELLNDSGELNLSFLNDVITKDNIVDILSNDLDEIILIVRNLKELGIIGGLKDLDFKDETTQNTLVEVIKTIFNLSVVETKEATILDGILTSFGIKEELINYGIELDYDNVTSWDDEINNICNMFTKIMSLTGDFKDLSLDNLFDIIEDENEKNKIAEVIEAFATSKIFGDSIYNMINKLLENYSSDYSVSFTQDEKDIIKNETGWKNEILNLLDIFKEVEPILDSTDYSTLEADVIKNIMLKASNGIISAKILGTELNKLFDGVIEGDFRNRETLSSSADVVYNAIKLSQMVNDESFDLENTEQVDELVGTITNFAKDEKNLDLVNQFVNEIVSPDEEITLSKEEINDAADIVEDVFNTYQNTENKDEFTLDDLSDEQKEKLENSEFAELILDYFFKKN